jgi:ERF superfamily
MIDSLRLQAYDVCHQQGVKAMETKDIHEALFRLQGELRGVKKDLSNPHFKNRYASLEQVTDTIRPHMQAAGLYWFQHPGAVVNGCLEVTTRIVHVTTGNDMSFTMMMPLGKQDPQGAGSAMTYAMRYSLMAALGLPPTDDDAETAIDRDNKRSEPEKPKEELTFDGMKMNKPAPKNMDARELFKKLQNEFRALNSVYAIKEWWKANEKLIRELPPSWQVNLREALAERKTGLEAH